MVSKISLNWETSVYGPNNLSKKLKKTLTTRETKHDLKNVHLSYGIGTRIVTNRNITKKK